MKNRDASTTQREATRKIADLAYIVGQMEYAANELDRYAEAEEVRTRTKDLTNPACSTFAKSARERAHKLRASVHRLKMEIEAARAQSLTVAAASALASAPLDLRSISGRRGAVATRNGAECATPERLKI